MLQEDTHAEVVDCVAIKLGLQRLGWIFTDLLAEDVRKGTVKYLRHKVCCFVTLSWDMVKRIGFIIV